MASSDEELATSGDENAAGLSSRIDDLFSAVLVATKASNGLGGQRDFLQSFPEWQAKEDSVTSQITSLLQLLQLHVNSGASAAGDEDLEAGDGGDDWGVLDCDDAELFDPFADTTELLLDEVRKFLAAGTEQGAGFLASGLNQFQKRQKVAASVSAMAKLPKPQAQPGFKHHAASPPDNCRAALFTPRPWDGRKFPAAEHPFGQEINQVAALSIAKPPSPRTMPAALPAAAQSTSCAPPLDGSSGCLWVDSEEALGVLGDALRAEEAAVAIDLEHHSFRSFQGLTCLIQLTCSRGDFIVDALSPAVRPLLGATLGPVLSDPAIVKVLHGANSDVLWLARDFGLYIVNMFDTGQAARQLEYPSASLAYLLERHARLGDIGEMKGKYQLSDWRVRPLEPGQLRYARSDTHFLLAIYDQLLVELWRKNGEEAIRNVMDLSTAICKQSYEKEVFDPEGWRKISLGSMNLSVSQQHRAQILWDWRDETARSADESPAFVLPLKFLARIVTATSVTTTTLAELTRDANGGLGCPAVVAASAEITLRCSAAQGKQPPLSQYSPVTNPAAISRLRTSSSPFTFTPASSAASAALSLDVDGRHLKVAEAASPKNLYTVQSSPSPVLDTEELYRKAGWISGLAAADEDGEDSEGRSSSSGDVTAASAAVERVRQETELRPFGPLVAATFQTSSTASSAENIDETEFKLKVSAQLLIDGVDEEEGAEVEADDSDGDEGETAPSMDGIPRAMSDIYKISNRNRRRNKEKKKMRESHGNEDANVPASTGERFDYFSSRDDKRQKGEEEGKKSTADFLQEIGWVSTSKKEVLLAGSSAIGHFRDTGGGASRAPANPYLADDE